MHTTSTRIRHDGWTPARRIRFLEARRVGSKVVDACAWAGMSSAGAYALAKRKPGFAAPWLAAHSMPARAAASRNKSRTRRELISTSTGNTALDP